MPYIYFGSLKLYEIKHTSAEMYANMKRKHYARIIYTQKLIMYASILYSLL